MNACPFFCLYLWLRKSCSLTSKHKQKMLYTPRFWMYLNKPCNKERSQLREIYSTRINIWSTQLKKMTSRLSRKWYPNTLSWADHVPRELSKKSHHADSSMHFYCFLGEQFRTERTFYKGWWGVQGVLLEYWCHLW